MEPVTTPTPTIDSTISTPPIQPTPQYAPQNPNFFKTKKGLLIVISVLLILGIIGCVAWILSMPKKLAPTPTTTPNQSQNEKSQDIKTYPKFQFTYDTPTTFPQPKAALLTYQIKNSFSDSDISSFGAQFGFSAPESISSGAAYFSDYNNTTIPGYLMLNTDTGVFDYENFSQSTKINGSDIKTGTKNFLASLGLADKAIECNITYKNSIAPELTFVECHRSWSLIGAPIVNLPGVLNIPMTQKITEMQVGYNYAPLEDPNIIDVSTGQNGIDRPNDFNTATFAIDKDGIIMSIKSSLRWIESEKTSQIITPDSAYGLLKNNKAENTIAIPSGIGEFDWNTVFPKGGVGGNNAKIDGFELVYIDNGASALQKTYAPVYLFRGNVTLNNGYNVNFIQTIPASKNLYSGVQIASNSLQLQTFTPAPTSINPTQEIISPTPATNTTPTLAPDAKAPPVIPSQPYDCSDTSQIGSPDIQTFTVIVNGESVKIANPASARSTFYVAEKTTDATEITKYRDLFYKALAQQYVWNYRNGQGATVPTKPLNSNLQSSANSDYVYNIVMKEYNTLLRSQSAGQNHGVRVGSGALTRTIYAYSPCYLTGMSPTVFLYSDTPQNFSVKPSFAVYTEPLTSNAWNIIANKTGILKFDDAISDYLYYEFNPKKVTFEKQEKGFILLRDDIKSFAPKLSQEMKLNSKESERLLFELELAAKDLPVNTEFIKISLVPNSELNSKLPLSVSPEPEQTNRYHFVLSKASKSDKSDRPSIPTVKRGSSTLVELGASTL